MFNFAFPLCFLFLLSWCDVAVDCRLLLVNTVTMTTTNIFQDNQLSLALATLSDNSILYLNEQTGALASNKTLVLQQSVRIQCSNCFIVGSPPQSSFVTALTCSASFVSSVVVTMTGVNLSINNVVVQNCQNFQNDNALFKIIGGSVVSVSSSSFNSNSGIMGGLFEIADANLTLTNCTAINNKAVRGGLIYGVLGVVNLISSSFTGNEAFGVGGVICCADCVVIVQQSKFISNKAALYGGAFHLRLTILVITPLVSSSSSSSSLSVFQSNVASAGGAIWNEIGISHISGCLFLSNLASPSLVSVVNDQLDAIAYMVSGGALYLWHQSLVTYVPFVNATFASENVSVQVGVTVSLAYSRIDGCTFDENQALSGGAIMADTIGALMITNSVFTRNLATVTGGCVYTIATYVFGAHIIANNNAAACSACMYFAYGMSFVRDSAFNYNYYVPQSDQYPIPSTGLLFPGFGSGLWYSGPSQLTFPAPFPTSLISDIGNYADYNIAYNLTFISNVGTCGSAFYNDNHANSSLAHCLFQNNYGANGGAIYSAAPSALYLSNTAFINNTAWAAGSAIYLDVHVPFISSNNVFVNNTSPLNAIFFQKALLSLPQECQGCLFSNNLGSLHVIGGLPSAAFVIHPSSSLTITALPDLPDIIASSGSSSGTSNGGVGGKIPIVVTSSSALYSSLGYSIASSSSPLIIPALTPLSVPVSMCDDFLQPSLHLSVFAVCWSVSITPATYALLSPTSDCFNMSQQVNADYGMVSVPLSVVADADTEYRLVFSFLLKSADVENVSVSFATGFNFTIRACDPVSQRAIAYNANSNSVFSVCVPQLPSYSAGVLPIVWQVIGALLFVGVTVAHVIIEKKKTMPVIKAASPVFCHVVLGGIGLFSAALISNSIYTPTASSCQATMWLLHIGFTFVFAPTFLKSYRVWAIFGRKQIKFVKISNNQLFFPLLVLTGIQLILLTVWMILYPPFVASSSTSTLLYSVCNYGSSGFLSLFIVIDALLLVINIVVAIAIRNAPSLFSEAKFIGLSVYAVGFVVGVIIGLLESVSLSPDSQTLFINVGILFSLITLFVFLLGAKIYYVLYPERGDEFTTGASTHVGASHAGNASHLYAPGDALSGVNSHGGSRGQGSSALVGVSGLIGQSRPSKNRASLQQNNGALLLNNNSSGGGRASMRVRNNRVASLTPDKRMPSLPLTGALASTAAPAISARGARVSANNNSHLRATRASGVKVNLHVGHAVVVSNARMSGSVKAAEASVNINANASGNANPNVNANVPSTVNDDYNNNHSDNLNLNGMNNNMNNNVVDSRANALSQGQELLDVDSPLFKNSSLVSRQSMHKTFPNNTNNNNNTVDYHDSPVSEAKIAEAHLPGRLPAVEHGHRPIVLTSSAAAPSASAVSTLSSHAFANTDTHVPPPVTGNQHHHYHHQQQPHSRPVVVQPLHDDEWGVRNQTGTPVLSAVDI